MNIVHVDGMDPSLISGMAKFCGKIGSPREKNYSKKPASWGKEIEIAGERRLQ